MVGQMRVPEKSRRIIHSSLSTSGCRWGTFWTNIWFITCVPVADGCYRRSGPSGEDCEHLWDGPRGVHLNRRAGLSLSQVSASLFWPSEGISQTVPWGSIGSIKQNMQF